MKLKVGQKLYVPAAFYLSHGADDFEGGIATISGFNEYGFVEVSERPGHFYNPKHLLAEQKELKERFGTSRAHRSPDLRGEFNCPYDYSKEKCPIHG